MEKTKALDIRYCEPTYTVVIFRAAAIPMLPKAMLS